MLNGICVCDSSVIGTGTMHTSIPVNTCLFKNCEETHHNLIYVPALP